MSTHTLPGTLKTPVDLDHNRVKIWLEQQIWGHRFLNDQSPWFLLLEALGLIAFRSQNGKPIFEGLKNDDHENFSYTLMKRTKLRHLLFRDRHIDEIADRQAFSDQSMWDQWFTKLGRTGREDYGYLRDRFSRFTSFRNAVVLLRAAEVESDRAKRTTSRHLTPRGTEMLTADYGEKNTEAVNKDRRFFARGGELLYLMLNRSAGAADLAPLIQSMLLVDGSRWNSLAKILQPGGKSEGGVQLENIGYLPLKRHVTYDELARDWIALLSMKGLPGDNLPEALMRLSGLWVLQYLTRRSAEVLEDEAPIFPIDMMSADTVSVKTISKDCFRRHREQSRQAIGKIVDDFTQSADWNEALGQANPEQAIKLLVDLRFQYKWKGGNPASLPAEIKREALSDHEQHLGSVAGLYADRIGLAVSRRAGGRWYAISDPMMEALVLANVQEPMELETFLDVLWNRYRIVIGTEAGRTAFDTVNYGHLKANQRLFEERLRILGLATRLSDDCAFVRNPYWS